MSQAETIRILLLVGGSHHDDPDIRATLSDCLGRPGHQVTTSEALDVLTRDRLANFDVVVNNTTDRLPTDDQHYALIDFVAGGKGLIAIHGGVATFWNSPAYFAMTGGKFVTKSLRGKGEFTVQIATAPLVEDHPITMGIGDYTVCDELFVIEGDQTQWHVLGRSQGHPAFYTKSFGRGRVFVSALGHDTGELARPTFQTILLNAVEWVAGLS